MATGPEYSFDITADASKAIAQINRVNSELDSLQDKAKNINIGANSNAMKSQINTLSSGIAKSIQQGTNQSAKNVAKQMSSGISKATTSGITQGVSKAAGSSNANRIYRDFNKVVQNASADIPNANIDKLFRGDAKSAQQEWAKTTKKYAKAIVDNASNPSAQAQVKAAYNNLRTQRNVAFTDKYSKDFDSIQNSANKAFENVQKKGLSTYAALDPTPLKNKLADTGNMLGNQKTWGGDAPEKAAKAIQDARSSVEDYAKLADTLGGYGKTIDSLQNSATKAMDSVEMKGRHFSKNVDVNGFRDDLDNLGETLRSKATWNNSDFQAFDKNISRMQSRVKELSNPENIIMDNSSIAKYAQKMSRALNGQMSGKTRKIGENYMNQIQDALEGSAEINVKDWRTKNIPGMETFMAKAAKENNGATGFFKRFSSSLGAQNAQFLAQYFSTQDMINYGKQMAGMSTRVDSALTELRKVSDASPERLAQSKRTNAVTAQKYGITLSDAINSTADWSRLGNSLKDSEKLAGISALFQSVGDNQDQQSVEETLTSVQRAWKQTPKQLKRSLDSINQICVCCPLIARDMKQQDV